MIFQLRTNDCDYIVNIKYTSHIRARSHFESEGGRVSSVWEMGKWASFFFFSPDIFKTKTLRIVDTMWAPCIALFAMGLFQLTMYVLLILLLLLKFSILCRFCLLLLELFRAYAARCHFIQPFPRFLLLLFRIFFRLMSLYAACVYIWIQASSGTCMWFTLITASYHTIHRSACKRVRARETVIDIIWTRVLCMCVCALCTHTYMRGYMR